MHLNKRQIAVNLANTLSFYSRVQKILIDYQLPGLENLQEVIPTKEQWKLLVKQTVNKYWMGRLKAEASEKLTLC